MAKSKINLTEDQEKEIIEFYLVPNSAREVECKFTGVNLYQLTKLLKKYHVTPHDETTKWNLRNNRSKIVCLEKYGVENPSTLESTKEKAKKSDFYKNAITTWTVRDVNKFKMAELNKLNYLAFYNMDEAILWLKNLQKGVVDD